ncbi:MAG: hypothetical protein ACFHWX_04145 [Bacteroidota bacterium]
MKLHSKFLVVLLTVFSTTSIIAKPNSTESTAYCKVVAEKTEKMYKVVYNSPFKEDVTIEIYNQDKSLVHTEKLHSTTGFIKRYNLSFLALGEYEFIVKSADYQFEESIDLGGLSKFKVQLKNSGKNVSFVGSHPEGKDLNVYIYDQNNDLLYTDELKEMKQVNKTYNLEKIAGKSVSFLIFYDNTLIKKEIFDL